VSRRNQIIMTEGEIAEFLAPARNLQVATINQDGTPHLVTMYYAVIDGKIVFWTYRKSQKVLNLRRDPRITVLVEDGKEYGELRGVQITGRATLSEDHDAVMAVGERLFVRYFGDDLDDAARAGVEASAAKRVSITVEPDHIVSWDHTKLGGGY
jgi:PPOX class probable F420-dependent enzyme